MRGIVVAIAALLVAGNAHAARWSTAGGCDIDANVGRDDVVHLSATSTQVQRWYNAEIVGHEWGCSLFVTGEINGVYRAIGQCYIEDSEELLQIDITENNDNDGMLLLANGVNGSFEIELVDRCY